MQVIEELLYQKTAQGLDWFFSVWWYWLPAGIGFLFRFGLLKYKIWDPEMRVKAILKDIGIVFGLTILWSSMNSAGLDDNAVVMLIILTFVYIFYGLAESCEDTGGTTESLLLIIKSVFVTMLSFQTIWGTLFGAVLTGVLAVLAYKFWFGVEKNSRSTTQNTSAYNDGAYCPNCKEKMEYDYYHYAHIGSYHCTN